MQVSSNRVNRHDDWFLVVAHEATDETEIWKNIFHCSKAVNIKGGDGGAVVG